jgi:hypothetical protein
MGARKNSPGWRRVCTGAFYKVPAVGGPLIENDLPLQRPAPILAKRRNCVFNFNQCPAEGGSS